MLQQCSNGSALVAQCVGLQYLNSMIIVLASSPFPKRPTLLSRILVGSMAGSLRNRVILHVSDNSRHKKKSQCRFPSSCHKPFLDPHIAQHRKPQLARRQRWPLKHRLSPLRRRAETAARSTTGTKLRPCSLCAPAAAVCWLAGGFSKSKTRCEMIMMTVMTQ